MGRHSHVVYKRQCRNYWYVLEINERLKVTNKPFVFKEFPAVLLNLQTGTTEAELAQYVKPTQFPILSEFCMKLTGIKQTDVGNASILKDVLVSFDEWIKRLSTEKKFVFRDDGDEKQNVAICTWTDFDIGVYLKGECSRKLIEVPDYFNRRIDARTIYKVIL